MTETEQKKPHGNTGRKRVFVGEKASAYVHIRVKPSVLAHWRQEAAQCDMSLSEYVVKSLTWANQMMGE